MNCFQSVVTFSIFTPHSLIRLLIHNAVLLIRRTAFDGYHGKVPVESGRPRRFNAVGLKLPPLHTASDALNHLKVPAVGLDRNFSGT